MAVLLELLLITCVGCIIVLGLTRLLARILRSQRYLLIGALVGALLVPVGLTVVGLLADELLPHALTYAEFPTVTLVALVQRTLLESGWLSSERFLAGVLNWILLGLAIGAVLRLLHARPGASHRPQPEA